MNILVIHGHPNEGSYNRALVDAYADGARSAGATVRTLDLGALEFDPVLHHGYAKIQPLEPDLLAAQADIEWCDHLVLGFPVWWGAPPAPLKGFFDRTFLPGWAFKFRGRWPLPQKLLKGRTAHVIVTMDSPQPVYSAIYWRSAHRAVIRGVLRFCGIGPVTTSTVGGVKFLPEAVRTWHVRRQAKLGESVVPARLRPTPAASPQGGLEAVRSTAA